MKHVTKTVQSVRQRAAATHSVANHFNRTLYCSLQQYPVLKCALSHRQTLQTDFLHVSSLALSLSLYIYIHIHIIVNVRPSVRPPHAISPK
jgi:uncharacterized membrane protein